MSKRIKIVILTVRMEDAINAKKIIILHPTMYAFHRNLVVSTKRESVHYVDIHLLSMNPLKHAESVVVWKLLRKDVIVVNSHLNILLQDYAKYLTV